MNVNGFELIDDWKVSNIGFTAKAKKGGKLYFLKKYGEYVMPRRNASTSEKLYAKLSAEFNSFKKNRERINGALKDIAGVGGNIILPTYWFVDDLNYIEATEFVSDLIEDEEILRLSKEQILFVMLTAAGALSGVHRKNIVHSDLKLQNVIAARNTAGKIVAKIIDFDRSYFADDIRPDELGGSQNYMSPELTYCFMCDMADEAIAKLSTKSDVFSLGIIFYNYLTNGDYPKVVGLTGSLCTRKVVYSGEALLNGAKLIISSEIKEDYLKRLIAAMLQPDPNNRPSSQEVLAILKTKEVLPYKSDSQIVIEDGTTAATPSRPTAVEKPAVPKDFCSPWDEHSVTFDIDKIKASGYVASEQTTVKSKKCYYFYSTEGKRSVFTIEIIKMLGWLSGDFVVSKTTSPARKAPPAVTTKISGEDGTWEEDAEFELDIDEVVRRGYKGIAKAEKSGRKGYALIKVDDSTQFVLISQLKLLGFAKKK